MIYDLVIIGGGPGGYVAAIRASQLGMKTALVEQRKTLGGTCLNVGCIPSKALLDTNGVDVFHGVGRLADSPSKEKAHTVEVEDVETQKVVESLQAERVLLATGSEPVELPSLPFDGVHIISSTEALALQEVPEHLVIVGAGVIGLELGSVWARLGARITVIELLPQIFAGWSETIARTVRKELEKQGIAFRLSTSVVDAAVARNGVTLTLEDAGAPVAGSKETDSKGAEPGSQRVAAGNSGDSSSETLSADLVLVAVGRRANLGSVNLEATGIQTDRGKASIDDNFETSVPGVYAIGDIVTGPMLAHKAEEEGIAAVERMAGVAGHVNYDVIPGVLYTWPEAASVGKSEEDLKDEGSSYRKGSFPFAKGLEGVIAAESRICKIDGENGRLYYYGYPIHELVEKTSYEETTYLLLYGELPGQGDFSRFIKRIRSGRGLQPPILQMIREFPRESHPMELLQSVISYLSGYVKHKIHHSPYCNCRDTLHQISQIPTVIAALHRFRSGQEDIPPRDDLNHGSNFLYMLRGTEPDPEDGEIMDKCFILHAEHSFNASTFTARVVASTMSTCYSSISAAIGALYGSLHGGTNERVMKMVDDIGTVEETRSWVEKRLERKEKVMGMGHRVYRAKDPRSIVMEGFLELLSEKTGNRPYLEILKTVESTFREKMEEKGKPIYPNIDFFSGAVYRLLGIPSYLYTDLRPRAVGGMARSYSGAA